MVRGCNTGCQLLEANAGCTKHICGVGQGPVARNSTATRVRHGVVTGSSSRPRNSAVPCRRRFGVRRFSAAFVFLGHARVPKKQKSKKRRESAAVQKAGLIEDSPPLFPHLKRGTKGSGVEIDAAVESVLLVVLIEAHHGLLAMGVGVLSPHRGWKVRPS